MELLIIGLPVMILSGIIVNYYMRIKRWEK